MRAQLLNNFAQITANPMDSPYIKRDELNRQRAEALELNDVVKTQDEVEADSNNQMAQMTQQLQMRMAQAQAAEAEARAAKTQAEAALTMAKAVDAKVESVFAALQAAGIAVTSPHIAPAGDEILRSSGWVDENPQPGIANMMGPDAQGPAGPAFDQTGQPQPGQPQAPQPPQGGWQSPQTNMARPVVNQHMVSMPTIISSGRSGGWAKPSPTAKPSRIIMAAEVAASSRMLRASNRSNMVTWRWYISTRLLRIVAEARVTFERNIIAWRSGQAIKGPWDKLQAVTGSNCWWNSAGEPVTFLGKPLTEWQSAGHEQGSIVAFPGFVDPDRHDYRLKPEAPTLPLGFIPHDWGTAGVSPVPKNSPSAIP